MNRVAFKVFASADFLNRVAFRVFALTPRELEILEHIAQGSTYPQIAARLFISRDTVRNHVSKIYKKLQVKSKTDVIQMANKNDWFKG